ncbi:MAG: CHAT domain-containing protein [Chloroflexota bacterium]
MTTEDILQLINDLQALDPEKDSDIIRHNHQLVLSHVDKINEPQKWGFIQFTFAQLFFMSDPDYAIKAYQDALEVIDPQKHRDLVLEIHSHIGSLFSMQFAQNPEAIEQAIYHLSKIIEVSEYQVHANGLALLYKIRTIGDRLENWHAQMKYLGMALSLTNKFSQSKRWASINNEVGLAWQNQPNGNFDEQLDKSVACFQASIDALGENRGDTWIKTQTFLSQAYLFQENYTLAEKHARKALGQCDDSTSSEVYRKAIQAITSIMSYDLKDHTAEQQKEALELLKLADKRIDPITQPEAAADIERSRAIVLKNLIEHGETERLTDLTKSTGRGKQILGQTHPDRRMVFCKLEAEAFMSTRNFANAIAPLEEALGIGHEYLQHSTSIDGRLETIRETGSLGGLLGYCLAMENRLEEALIALERGKGLVWDQSNSGKKISFSDVKALVPENGVLLFGCFSSSPGIVIIVSEEHISQVRLPNFGKPELMALQRGENFDEALGGWLLKYLERDSERAAWEKLILQFGQQIYKVLWEPILSAMDKHSFTEDGEIVWFHQGGSSIFPLHAAWTGNQASQTWLIDDYTIRFASSVKSLLGKTQTKDTKQNITVISNPENDLAGAELENSFVTDAFEGKELNLIRGNHATPASVISAFEASDILHVAAHAVFNFSDPWQSHVRLANQTKLTVLECMNISRMPNLVSLGACETGLVKVSAVEDEFLGMSTLFLRAGAHSVLATLWPIADRVSPFLIGRFYEEYTSGKSPARALRDAQNWTRNLTAKQLLSILAPYRKGDGPESEIATTLTGEFRSIDRNSKPFAEPHYWAAFTVFGL